MRKQFGALALLLGLLVFTSTASATTLTIIGGRTTVNLTSLDLFDSLGLDLNLLGSATISGSSVIFPITGGTVDSETGFSLVEHNGSGISFGRDETLVELANFFIDTESALLSGEVTVDGAVIGSDVALFDFTPNRRLNLTTGAASVLSSAFGLDIPAGTEIGIATVLPKTIPLPGAVWLMLGGLATLRGLRKSI